MTLTICSIFQPIKSAGQTYKSEKEFRNFVEAIAPEYTAENYKLFSRNCREYSNRLIDYLQPDKRNEGKLE